jgi:flagellar biosynthesis/type III secretory pathway protein FliH
MTTEQQETATDPARPSLKTFKPTAFQLSQFEVVEQSTVVDSFQVSKFVSLGSASPAVDPMFEVYDRQFTSEPRTGNSDDTREEQQAHDAEAEAEAEADPEPSAEDVGANEEEVAVQEFDLEAHERELAANQAEEDRKALEVEHARQLEEVRTTAREDALAEARRESEEKLKAIEERYASLIDDMSVQIREGVEGVERRAVDFAIHIAKKLVGAIVEVNPEYVLGIIKEAVKLTGGATIKVIRVSPQDLEFLKLLSPDRQFKEFDGSWSFQADETIHAGCVLETSSGEVEFELDKAWERIKESVLKVR